MESNNIHTLCIALKISKNFTEQQDEYFRGHLNHLIPACLKLSQFNSAMVSENCATLLRSGSN